MPQTTIEEQVWAILSEIPDPELPVPITDLGIVHQVRVADGAASVTLIPTFLGCPALDFICKRVRERLENLPELDRIEVNMVNSPAWSPDLITDNGREILRSFGVTVPPHSGESTCPFCNSADIKMESPFGPQRCRMIYYCNACRKPFELFKKV